MLSTQHGDMEGTALGAEKGSHFFLGRSGTGKEDQCMATLIRKL